MVPRSATDKLRARRMAAQQLIQPRCSTPAEVVAWMGAVQAQDHAGAKWAIALRCARAVTDENIEGALNDGTILRTHALRGTWQLVSPADIHWLLALVGPRVVARNATRYRQLGLDATTFRRAAAALAKTLGDGPRTRAELRAALERARIPALDQRLSHLLQRVELDGLVCSGPTRGKQRTYALLETRAPRPARTLARDQALAELARRYFTSRGPATLDDFVWWSGLPAAEARAGLGSVEKGLPVDAADAPATRGAQLLPPFDEYLIAYRDRSAILDPVHAKRVNAGGGLLDPIIVVDGRVAGTWRRTIARGHVLVELDFFAAPARRAEVARATERYGAFLGLPVRLR